MIPIFAIDGHIVCFDALREDVSAREYFTKHCGWTAKECKNIERFAFFTAHVSLWKDGDILADEYLGACCYETEKQFYTEYAADYFADMVSECFINAGIQAPEQLNDIIKTLHEKGAAQ